MRILIAAIMLVLCVPAQAKIHSEYDRHALYSVGSEAVITERAVRKVRTAGLKQIRRKHQRKHRERITDAPAIYAAAQISAPLVDKARALIGQTAAQLGLPQHLWCADFIAKIAPEAARKVSNPRWARDYAELPKTGPKIGAIAVLSRGNGGHIGVISGFDSRGNPIIISGNHGHRVAEAKYPKHRVIAYVNGGSQYAEARAAP